MDLKLQMSQVPAKKEATMTKRYTVMGSTQANKSDRALAHHDDITTAAATIAQHCIAEGITNKPGTRGRCYVLDREDSDMLPVELVTRRDGSFDVVIKGVYCTYEVPFKADGTPGTKK